MYCILERENISDAVCQKGFCIIEDSTANCHLNTKHAYCYQTQMQLNVVKSADYCDFIIWKQGEIFIQQITADPIFWNEMVPKAELIFRTCILSEVFSNTLINFSKRS